MFIRQVSLRVTFAGIVAWPAPAAGPTTTAFLLLLLLLVL